MLSSTCWVAENLNKTTCVKSLNDDVSGVERLLLLLTESTRDFASGPTFLSSSIYSRIERMHIH